MTCQCSSSLFALITIIIIIVIFICIGKITKSCLIIDIVMPGEQEKIDIIVEDTNILE